MAEIKIGDTIEVAGDTQDYILNDPDKTYRGTVLGKDNGQLLVRLDQPVVRGPGKFHEATVQEAHANPVKKQ
ncbi:MAG: hypothetical protein QOE82_2234 [Thermoanaerobaculia bacterium]|jgi:hypothetical protein|nr:hypothetical protein [Thermoanaerobaculia bacterium]